MTAKSPSILDNLTRAGAILSSEFNIKSLISALVEQSNDISESDLAALYIRKDMEKGQGPFRLVYKRGALQVNTLIDPDDELLGFVRECGESAVITEPYNCFFDSILLHETMRSGIVLPLSSGERFFGLLYLNSRSTYFYNRSRLMFLDSFVKLAGGMINNARLYQELKEYLKEIEELKLYQENIFSSMTDILITTDRDGTVHYFNRAASETLGLTEDDMGKGLNDLFKNNVNRKILREIESVQANPREIMGIEGIFGRKDNDMEIDFSLNLSPLRGKAGNRLGTTLLMTDQTHERELQEKMNLVVEERRAIKDMFSRYLSTEIVKTLTDAPELVKPGGDKKMATIFFADIRGYTSFSEGKDPEYIIEILNEYFSEAVEIVIQNKGYIDKFIGDCIMAAWGVPLQTEKEDAIQAVSCAVQIQHLVNNKKRGFWKGAASGLKVGIGMHTGPLVAGNLGSQRRMNYTVIGDTVNVAARLEGVAGAGEIIITGKTREYLDDIFKLQERKPVKVKGKEQSIPIFNVIDFR